MKKSITLILSLIIFNSCSERRNQDLLELDIDISDIAAEYKRLADSDISFIHLQIPDTIIFAGIDHIKVYNDLVFLHDEGQTNSLTIVNREGEFINQLKNIGNGPGEYSTLNAFAFDEHNSVLSIYDRSRLSIFHYTFPNLKPIKNFQLNRYIMNMEYIDNETLMIVSENELSERGKYEGILYIDKYGKLIKYDFPINNDVSSIELSYPNTVVKISETVFYAHPHEITTIYRMEQSVQPVYRINFGKNRIPEKYWPVDNASEFERSLSEGNKAVWVQNLIFNKETLSFAFLYKEPSTRNFYSFDRNDSTEIVYKGYQVNNADYLLPYPIGSDGKNYISLIYKENVDASQIRNPNLLNALEKSDDSGGYVLAIYKP